jgi:hypothetical protein
VHVAEEVCEYAPDGQGLHADEDVAPIAFEADPDGHEVQFEALDSAEKVPAPQARQVLLSTAPTFGEADPAGHASQQA